MTDWPLGAVLQENFPDLWHVPTPPQAMSFDDVKWLWAFTHHAGLELRKVIEEGHGTPRRELVWLLGVRAVHPECVWTGPCTTQ